MPVTLRAARRAGRRRGLSMIELLICSTIAVLMLMATGLAFRASVMAYRDNTDRNLLAGHGRTAMRQLTEEIRLADMHAPLNDAALPNATALFAAGQITENSGIQLLKKQPDAADPAIVPGNAATWVLITWYYDAPSRSIRRSRSVGSLTTTATVAQYVQEFKVRMQPARSAANIAAGNTSFDLLLRAVVSITLQDVDAEGKLAMNQGSGLVVTRFIDAAVPRRHFAGL